MTKILVVDDEPLNCRLVKEFLAGKAECDTCFSGEEALDKYNASVKENNPYDLVLLDVAMPKMDGLTVLEKIRSEEDTRGIKLGCGIPVIILTAVKNSFMSAFKKGAEEYILKPVARDALFKKIDEVLSKKKQAVSG